MIGGVHGLGVSGPELEAAKTALEQQIQESKETLDALTGSAGDAVVIGAGGKPAVQPLAGTDYTTQRVRGISFHPNEAPAGIPNGGMAGVYELA